MDERGLHLPPGFRFHPSDEELIIHYLQNKVTSNPLPASIIAEIDLYRYNPWELPKKALFGENEWYFFSPRDRKYPNGARPNRAAASGYWKATGTDKPILTSSGSKSIGVKKALVFYTGRPPKGVKTDWIMNEYRLLDNMVKPSRMKGSMRLDDWVLCRVRQKGNMSKNTYEVQDRHSTESAINLEKNEEAHPKFTDYKADMITDCLNQECQLLAFILANQAVPPMETIPSVNFQGSKPGSSFTSVHGDGPHKVNSLVTVSSLDSHYNPQKRKPIVEHGYQNLLPSKKKVNNDNRNEELPLSKTRVNNDMNYYSQNQSQNTIYNPNPLDPIIDFQELNELAFTGKYLE